MVSEKTKIRKIDFLGNCIVGSTFTSRFLHLLKSKFLQNKFQSQLFSKADFQFITQQGWAPLSASFGFWIKKIELGYFRFIWFLKLKLKKNKKTETTFSWTDLKMIRMKPFITINQLNQNYNQNYNQNHSSG